jgi:hypothetical protein
MFHQPVMLETILGQTFSPQWRVIGINQQPMLDVKQSLQNGNALQ